MREKPEEYSAEELDRKREERAVEVRKAIHRTLDALRKKGFVADVVHETDEEITLQTVDINGKNRVMGFMKYKGVEERIAERVRDPGPLLGEEGK